jgi:hypothetical protein
MHIRRHFVGRVNTMSELNLQRYEIHLSKHEGILNIYMIGCHHSVVSILPCPFYPLYTDTTGSVRGIVSGNLNLHLQPRLTNAASEELAILRNCLNVTNHGENDEK